MLWKEGVLSWILVCLLASTADGFEVDTHVAINRSAVIGSSLDVILRNQLGVTKGIDQRLAGPRTVEDWVSLAGRWEDDGLRFLNHFHDPLKAWSAAGLGIATASVIWAQDAQRNTWSWPRARRYYYEGLTSASPVDREAAMANAFRAIGQVMHLVADLAVPAHVRNDPHPRAYTLESWLLAVGRLEPARFAGFLEGTIGPDPGVLSFGANSEAPIPIARFWDTDQFTGLNPDVGGGTGVGLAEYTNANFLSEDTRFTDYVFPSRTSVRPEDFTIPDPREPSGTAARQYHVKWRHGDTGYRLATVGFLRDYFSRYLPERLGDVSEGLDDHVYSDYARRLLPRAVSYAKALLEYFFRGRLQASFAPGPNGGREVILRTQNVTGEPIGPGTLRLFYDNDSGERRLIQEQSVPELGDTSELPPLQFDVPAGPLSQYVVVYRGQLGGEPDAVAARVLADFPIVAVQELAALTGEETEEFNPFLGGGGGLERRKDPNQQRAAGSFWAGTAAGVGQKIREVRLEGSDALFGPILPKAMLRLNGKEVGPEWRAVEDPGFIPEHWEVILAPIPGKTLVDVVKPPQALWVNGFRTPLLWMESVIAATGQSTFVRGDGMPVWITTRSQLTRYYFGDGVGGLDPKVGAPLAATPRTGVSFRPVGEAAGGPVPRAEVEILSVPCSDPAFYRFQFVFATRPPFPFVRGGCNVGAALFWFKNVLWLQERVQTLGAQPDPTPPPLVTAATFRREFLDADLERFLSVGIVPLEYDIQTQ